MALRTRVARGYRHAVLRFRRQAPRQPHPLWLYKHLVQRTIVHFTPNPHPLLASWSASLHLALPSPLLQFSYLGCYPSQFLRVPQAAQRRPLVPLGATRTSYFVQAFLDRSF